MSLSQSESAELDQTLMTKCGFSIDQLMELAGMSAAMCIQNEYSGVIKKVLVICGPGNNGGDGLVIARYLKRSGYDVDVFLPKPTSNELYKRLINICEYYSIKIYIGDLPKVKDDEKENIVSFLNSYNVIIDAIFGFSFHGSPRPPYDLIMDKLIETKSNHILISIDVPSAWDVNDGPIGERYLQLDMLISLSAPKKCTEHFKGVHYVAGNFIPPVIREKYHLPPANLLYPSGVEFRRL